MRLDFLRAEASRTLGLELHRPLSVVHVATYPPRQCGIATFTEDLHRAIDRHPAIAQSAVTAMERDAEPCGYGPMVRWLVRDDRPDDYARAARLINNSGYHVVLLQFEYGIFGGPDGECVLRLLDGLSLPVVTGLHTVLPQPRPHQRDVLRAVAQRSRKLIVMNRLAMEPLEQVYRVPRRQVEVIPHGAPDFPRDGRQRAKDQLGLQGKRVLSTFGLLSRGKGLEYGIRAMRAVATRFPDACFFILGRTHPGVIRQEGKDAYREELVQLVRDLHLDEHVRFVNQYFEKSDLMRWLMATDTYITPYLNPDQIVSGTLAYAMVAGNAIVSTPYLHARELLSEGRGRLVPFRDADAIAEAVISILADHTLKRQMERDAYAFGRAMTWQAVAGRYVRLFQELIAGEPVRAPQPTPTGLDPITARS